MLTSMFEQIVQNLPADPQGVVITMLVCMGIAIGALTCLLGALHSRPTMALLMLTAGAIAGQVVPRYLGWGTNAPAMITIGAIVFGLIGFVLHRYCVALLLGSLVSVITLAVLYDQLSSTGIADILNAQGKLPTLSTLWAAGSDSFRNIALWVGLGAFAIASLIGFFIPKVGMAALYSIAGTLLTLFSISLGHASDKISWLDSIKTGPMTVAVLGMAMLAVGFLTQITLLHRPGSETPKRESKEERETAKAK